MARPDDAPEEAKASAASTTPEITAALIREASEKRAGRLYTRLTFAKRKRARQQSEEPERNI
jgi:hypothetical protein